MTDSLAPTFQDLLREFCGDDLDTPQSELDRWFPRPSPASEPDDAPDPPPYPGVIDGVKRDKPRRYGRRWYTALERVTA